jgi:periplasmic divalent cation tolerance protein
MLMIAWTTVASRADAERIAGAAVSSGLAACVQIDGPVRSLYRWEGKLETSDEFRLTFKCMPGQLPALEKHVLGTHPYDTPEWIVVEAAAVGEKYLSWAGANAHLPPL